MLSWFELKVPPPVVALIAAGLMWFLAKDFSLPRYDIPQRAQVCTALVIVGFLVDLAALWRFLKVSTTVNPLRPQNASRLVTSGIYRFSRNPMYVGNFIFLVAWSVWLESPYAFAGLAVYVFYMNRFQIKPEERMLESLFGSEYVSFCEQVRRWI